ncbi:putative Agenet-like domain-containing protein [Lupinus albus]|uniref:Putative Agenet-like domain-containing protein n=1 Tax=Lupinus albus TaxID=3870 RepID=A0A6A4QXC9_LUPAL|nr:putative Agenet-like domain-containing protein [Lupinus albus]
MDDLPFKVGDLAESKSFQRGFRGAWFRCKVRGFRTNNDMMVQLEYFDYPDQKLTWFKLYQKPGTSKLHTRELMLRPSFPTICHESQELDVNTITEVIVIVNNVWRVGDFVDWFKDGCYWSGRVTEILGNGKVQIDLLPPPLGEGSSYTALSKDLRPSLHWFPEKGWTVPMPMLQEDGNTFPCARINNPANSGIHGTDGTVNSCQSSEGPLNFPDRSMRKRKQCNIGRNDMEIDECDNKISKTCNLEMTSVNDGYNDENHSKMRCSTSLCLNSVSNSTMEAAILDLEELVNKIKWLRGVLDFEVPLLGIKQPSWEFLHHAPCK